ncbi:beta-3-deoxy-D-manno-oct-2-ulosonic acid transferase [Cupriavidus sp. WS]|uniref:capsular polysaccharide export protein, LipB/KpsS family n=1 Tax=Cupriavidus sp. WS TaxID=1312922 RepID=UPI0012DFC367|nr:beta-3-deoxy-D-manno-oct-2-ulosonic acid transferase [Cupriavidus sp. WS]
MACPPCAAPPLAGGTPGATENNNALCLTMSSRRLHPQQAQHPDQGGPVAPVPDGATDGATDGADHRAGAGGRRAATRSLRRAPGVLTAPDFEWKGPPLSETWLARPGEPGCGWIDRALDAMPGPAAGDPRAGPHARAHAVAQAVAEARIGGTFWGSDPVPRLDALDGRPLALLRPGNLRQAGQMLALALAWELAPCLVMPGTAPWKSALRALVESRGGLLWRDPVDPWPLLDRCRRVVVDGNDGVGFLALLRGMPVTCVQPGYLSGRGLTDDLAPAAPKPARTLAQLADAVLLQGTRYVDPFTGKDCDGEAVIALLAFWRTLCHMNREVACCTGMALWKRADIARFFHSGARPVPFFAGARRPVLHAAARHGAVAVWASRESAELSGAAGAAGVPLYRVEDGFIRSRGLGSDLYPPMSIVVDRRGIYYDPASGSDLEVLLAQTDFAEPLLRRARNLRTMLVAHRITKYGDEAPGGAVPVPAMPAGRRRVLVPGQVTDDASLRLGGAGIGGNLELLRRVRAAEPDAYIVFKPHPDVEAGHRPGALADEDALRHADAVVRGTPLAVLLDVVDAVHTLTSLAGFEALLRGREVVVHGQPFYAGWGLTRDLAPMAWRRRRLTLDELVAGALLLYPRYLDPHTGLPCPPEVLVQRFAQQRRGGASALTRLRRMQGLAARQWRAWRSRVGACAAWWSGLQARRMGARP